MPKQAVVLDRTFAALADPTRRLMVERLARGPATVSELKRPLPISLPAVVQHLQILQESGLVATGKKGRVRTCWIEPKAFEVAQTWLDRRRAEWEARVDRLEAFLEEREDD